MIYKFTIISEETEGFVRDIQIDSESTFLALHKSIFASVNYSEVSNAAFYICDQYWDKENEVLLKEIDNNPEFDTWLMEDTTLNYFLEEEHQRLMHVFDLENERGFHIELTEIIPGKSLNEAKCTRSRGKAPQQFLDEDEIVVPENTVDLDEDFYGSVDFDLEEIAPFEEKEEENDTL
ncbi:MAG: hypothetical protein GX905_05875 [Bacteroidales bacterium]|nr:hypothetical protein [Bacteroidales bacterium]